MTFRVIPVFFLLLISVAPIIADDDDFWNEQPYPLSYTEEDSLLRELSVLDPSALPEEDSEMLRTDIRSWDGYSDPIENLDCMDEIIERLNTHLRHSPDNPPSVDDLLNPTATDDEVDQPPVSEPVSCSSPTTTSLPDTGVKDTGGPRWKFCTECCAFLFTQQVMCKGEATKEPHKQKTSCEVCVACRCTTTKGAYETTVHVSEEQRKGGRIGR